MPAHQDASDNPPPVAIEDTSGSGPSNQEPPLPRCERSYRWVVWVILYGIVLGTLTYALFPAWAKLFWQTKTPSTAALSYSAAADGFSWQSIELLQEIHLHLLEAFAVLWLFFVGASFGSFLNVIVYRLPRGMSLWGHSHCPCCGRPIRLRHNVPVLGWFWLSGRCYDCHQPIAFRYPLVEAAVGVTFLTVAIAEWISGGANLPLRPINVYRGVAWSVFDPQWDLIGLFAFHITVLLVLLSWALIQADGQSVPRSYTLWSFVAAVMVTTFFPSLHPVPCCVGVTLAKIPGIGLLSALGGALAGIGLGIVLFSLVDEKASVWTGWFIGLAGAAFGWQATFSIGLLVAVCMGITYIAQRLWPRVASAELLATARPIALWLAVALHLICWRPLTSWPYWPGPYSPAWVFPVAGLLAIVVIGWSDTQVKSDSVSPAVL